MSCSSYLINPSLCLLAAVLLIQGWDTNKSLVKAQCSDLSDDNCTVTILPPGAIAGIAVGGTVVLLSLFCFAFVICFCCYRRAKIRKSFNVMANGKGLTGSTADTLQVSPGILNGIGTIDSDSLEKQQPVDQFEMQANTITDNLLEDDSKTAESNHKPSTLFAGKKSFSSHEISRVQTVTAEQPRATNTVALSSGDKGYVQMSSAGSVRPSRSLDNLRDVPDAEIYTDPDILAAGLVQIDTGDLSSRRKPPVSPKPIFLQGNSSSPTKGMPRTLSPGPSVGPPPPPAPEEDYYVAADLFVKDREEQEQIDSYYNKDTIESIRKGMSLSDVVDPSQTDAVYANVDPPPTPQHTVKPTSTSPSNIVQTPTPKDEYESIEDYIGSKAAPSTVTPPPDSTEYYNTKHTSDTSADENNYAEVAATDKDVNPYALEDDMYVYMKSNTISPLHDLMADQPAPSLPQRTEPSPKPIHKYQNLDFDLENETVTASPPSASPKKVARNDPKIMTELHFPPQINSDSVASQSPASSVGSGGKQKEDEVKLYVNVTHDEGTYEGEEELYEVLT